MVERLENILEIYFLNASIGKILVVLVNDESLDTRGFFERLETMIKDCAFVLLLFLKYIFVMHQL